MAPRLPLVLAVRGRSASRPGPYSIAAAEHESPPRGSDFVLGDQRPVREPRGGGGPGPRGPGPPPQRAELTLLHRCADEGAVLRPGSVVVLDGSVPEQLGQREPRVARALTDPAVGDDLLVGGHALALVQRLELIGRLERPILVRRLDPGDVRGAGDVAGNLRLLLRKAIGGQLLPPVLLRRANVDEGRPPHLGQDLVAEGPDLRALLAPDREPRGLGGRRVLCELTALELPLLPPAVQELHVVEPPEL